MRILDCNSDRGMRTYQEDRCFTGIKEIKGKEIILLAVMDGHGGSEAAEHCRSRIQNLFGVLFRCTSVEKTTLALREMLKTLELETNDMDAGTTISIVAIIDGKKAISAVLGDSPVVVLDRRKELVVGPNHNVRINEREAERAKSRGGFICDGYLFVERDGPGLQMARALGDRVFKDVLDRDPEIVAVDLDEESFILVASDGLFERPSHQKFPEVLDDAIDLVDAGYSADELVDWAKRSGSTDNTTVIIWKSEGN